MIYRTTFLTENMAGTIKKIKQIAAWLRLFLGIMCFFYLLHCFYSWQWLPNLWTEGSRFLFSFITVFVVIITTVKDYIDFD